MIKYMINKSVAGFETKDISDNNLIIGENNVVVLIIDEQTGAQLYSYYSNIKDILLSRNKFILIIVGEISDISKTISNLMCSYRKYNIYNVDSLDIIDKDYLNAVIKREATYEEAQIFVGADSIAYSEINTIILGINSLINDDNIGGLKAFLEKHINTIYKFTSAVDYMKMIIDRNNNEELNEKLKDLKETVSRQEKELEEVNNNIKAEISKKQLLEDDLALSKRQLSDALLKIEELESYANDKSPVIKAYNELNTTLIKCKAKIVIYFKEVSQIPYINSMVIALFQLITLNKLKVKLLVYDNKTGITNIYKPLHVIGSNEYMSKREMFKSKTEKLVVIEPNPTIIEDILTFSADPYDVVIVYDRMKQLNDVVVGNNVYKFFVINSVKDFKETQTILKINDKSSIITRADSEIGDEVLDIPKIDGYSSATDTAKTAKYIKATTNISKKVLLSSILEKARISAIKK